MPTAAVYSYSYSGICSSHKLPDQEWKKHTERCPVSSKMRPHLYLFLLSSPGKVACKYFNAIIIFEIKNMLLPLDILYAGSFRYRRRDCRIKRIVRSPSIHITDFSALLLSINYISVSFQTLHRGHMPPRADCSKL